MNRRMFVIVMGLILAIAVLAWTSGDAFAQEKVANAAKEAKTKDELRKEIAKDIAARGGKVTRDDQAKYLGKKGPTELKAAVLRARLLGLKPGIAGRPKRVY